GGGAGCLHRPAPGRQPRQDAGEGGSRPDPSLTGLAASVNSCIVVAMAAEYREEPCRSALNRVEGMDFRWSLNPYMGCVHRCTFCYVRAFELRADRPWDDRYGRSIRVKVNV